jgi:hypothetical protein
MTKKPSPRVSEVDDAPDSTEDIQATFSDIQDEADDTRPYIGVPLGIPRRDPSSSTTFPFPSRDPAGVSSTFGTTRTITLNGEEIKVSARPVTLTRHAPLITKEARDSLPAEKKTSLFNEATKSISGQTKYSFTSVNISDENRLEDLYSVLLLNSQTRAAHLQYDMHGVFTIVFPVHSGSMDFQDPAKKPPIDLYTQYDQVTEQEVATSCEWYFKWTEQSYYRENLWLTYLQLKNAMHKDLFEKCSERYADYPESQQGGPLLFIIMMKLLVSTTEEAITYLKTMVKNMKVTNYTGENITKVCSHLKNAHKHLRLVNQVPDDFHLQVLTILQTSSVPEFNEYFGHLQKTVRMIKDMSAIQQNSTSLPGMTDIESILRLAELRYIELSASGEWNGAKTKGKSSVFVSSDDTSAALVTKSNLTCWNCGKAGHGIGQCTEPRNDQRIAANKAKFQAAKAQSGGDGTPELRPPEPAEKCRRVINGKPMFWLKKGRKWVVDRNAEGGGGQAHTVTPTPMDSASKQATPSDSTRTNPAATAAIANASKSIQVALEGLANHFS